MWATSDCIPAVQHSWHTIPTVLSVTSICHYLKIIRTKITQIKLPCPPRRIRYHSPSHSLPPYWSPYPYQPPSCQNNISNDELKVFGVFPVGPISPDRISIAWSNCVLYGTNKYDINRHSSPTIIYAPSSASTSSVTISPIKYIKITIARRKTF